MSFSIFNFFFSVYYYFVMVWSHAKLSSNENKKRSEWVPLYDLSLYSSKRYTQHTKHLEAFKSRKFSFMFFWDFFFRFFFAMLFVAEVCIDSRLLYYYLVFCFIIAAGFIYGCVYWGWMWQTKIFRNNYRSCEMMQVLRLGFNFCTETLRNLNALNF